MNTLIDRAVIRCQDRTVSYTWLGVQDSDGNAPGVRLTIRHESGPKLIAATFDRFTRQQRNSYTTECYEIRLDGSGLSNSKQFAAIPCARYSDKALAGFVSSVLAMLVDDPHPCERFTDEAAELVGVTA